MDERIAKLIALATNNPSEHEARNAARKALELIDATGADKIILARNGTLRRLIQASQKGQ